MISNFDNVEELADVIEKSYLINLNKLDPSIKRHFLFRLYLSNKNETTKKLLLDHSKEYSKQQLKKIDLFNTRFTPEVESTRSFILKLKTTYPHLEKRYEVWKKNTDIIYLYFVLKECFYLKYLGINFKIDENRISKLLNKLLASQEFQKRSTTQAICIIYYLKYLGLLNSLTQSSLKDITTQIINEGIYSNSSEISEIFSYMYGLTHVIICDTYFYLQRPSNFWKPLVQDLNTLLLKYYKDLSLDLKVETLLCSLLFESNVEDVTSKVLLEASTNFNEDIKVIDNKKQKKLSHGSAEHTNALFLLCARSNTLLKSMGDLQLK